MSVAQSLLPENDVEMAAARRHLERVPGDPLGWQPDGNHRPPAPSDPEEILAPFDQLIAQAREAQVPGMYGPSAAEG